MALYFKGFIDYLSRMSILMELKRQENQMYQKIAEELEKQSQEICKDNGCTEDDHNCVMNAILCYKNGALSLFNVPCSDYDISWSRLEHDFHGCLIVITLPFKGGEDALRDAIEWERSNNKCYYCKG
jgi:hypothetical protein